MTYRSVTSRMLADVLKSEMERHNDAEMALEKELEIVRESRRELINRTNANKCGMEKVKCGIQQSMR